MMSSGGEGRRSDDERCDKGRQRLSQTVESVDLRAAVRSDKTRTTHAASVAVPTVERHGDQYVQNRHAVDGRLPHGATETNMQPLFATDNTNTRTWS